MKKISSSIIITILISLMIGNAYSQSSPKSSQGYSLSIQKIFPTKGKSEVIAQNQKTLANIDKLIATERTKRKNDNWLLTVTGPGNYKSTPVIQNIAYIVTKNDKITYIKSEEEVKTIKLKNYPSITNIIISECSVYGTIKSSDTINYNLNFKYYENNDSLKITEKENPKFSSEYYSNLDIMNKDISEYKNLINDNTKNRLLRAYQNNKQIFAFSNYEDYLKTLENKKKNELEIIAQKNKKIEEERIKKQIDDENNAFFDKLDLLECSKFNKFQQSVQSLMNDKSIKNLKKVKQIYINSNKSERQELDKIVDNLLSKDSKKNDK